MTSLNLRPASIPNTIEVWSSDALVGIIRFDHFRSEWLAEVDEQSRYCRSFGAALNFVEAVLRPGDWLDLRMPSLALH